MIVDGATTPKGEIKGRKGHILFRRHGNIVHPIQCNDRKLRWFSRSSSTAEPLAAADAVSDVLFIRAVLFNITATPPPTESTFDSTALQSLSANIKEPEESYNKVDLAAIREAHDGGSITAVLWCPGPRLLADPLTKVNRATAALLLDALTTRLYELPPEMTVNYGPGAPENRQ